MNGATKGFGNPSLWTFEVASTLFAAGRKSEAAAELRDFMAGHPDEGGLLASMQAVIYASTNQPHQAEEQIRLATLTHGAGFTHYHHTTYNIASAYSLLHNSSAAMKWLQMAANDGYPVIPSSPTTKRWIHSRENRL